jgi:RimJ/RimL family protein N-acetyltransferase
MLTLQSSKAKSGRSVSLRPAAQDDELLLYQWQIHPETREFARNPQPPTLREHRNWFAQRMGNDGSRIFIILHGAEPGGCLRLDRVANGPAPVWEVSINIAPDCHRLGLAKAALVLIREEMPGAELVAHVMPRNQASHALFRSAGFQHGADGNYHLVCAG